MRGATGNIYTGLHEYHDMGLVLHALRAGDTFLDIGANVGSYTVLASAVCGARTLAFEPDPDARQRLHRNIAVNAIEALVTVQEYALGAEAGTVAFTIGQDSVNRIAQDGAPNTRVVPIERLDNIPDALDATLIKLDVEGHEFPVLLGARSVLASPRLLAIITEGYESDLIALVESFGFVRRFYDPAERRLLSAPLVGVRPHRPRTRTSAPHT